MSVDGIVRICVFLLSLVVCAVPLGRYMARILAGENPKFVRFLVPVERVLAKTAGVNIREEMNWRVYAYAVLSFSFVGVLFTYALQRLQAMLPANPDGLPGVSADSATNTAISFVTNTNWQGYGGETTMSHLTQMSALTVQNFVSAAAGIAVLAALARGFSRFETKTIGNFWSDLIRSTVYVLLPLSFVMALALVSQGVVQTFSPAIEAALLEPSKAQDGQEVAVQKIAVGPVASQIAIKQLGTNGGGYFNTNSAHPYENPTPLSNFLEMLAIVLIPASLCLTFGQLIGDVRQGRAILAAMLVIFVPLLFAMTLAEQQGNPVFETLGVDQALSPDRPGGNMEGKETRFGIVDSAIWAVSTTAASNGSVNSMHDSYTPLGGLISMWLMQLGEVVFGGVGSGLYGMLTFAIVAVFVAGLMVGRTPEYLGKKIGAFEMKMASLVILIPCVFTLIGTALAVSLEAGRATIFNPASHGFSEVLYAFSSASNNNGSAFAGLGANTVFYNGVLGFAMLAGRFWLMIPVLAIAGSLAAKKHVPAGTGTLPTHTPLFVAMLVAVVIVVGALSFFPALALGPIIEQILLNSSGN